MSDQIEKIIAPVLADLGLDLESVEVVGNGKHRQLRIAVDADGGVGIDVIADATRAVSVELDASDAMGSQPYTLEVSSRGIDRPLTAPRHWRRNLDRLAAIRLIDGTSFEARIIASDDIGAQLGFNQSVTYFAYDQIESAVVQIELKRKDV